MSFVIADRVRETTQVVGTGAAFLLGPPAGYLPFSTIGDGNSTYYVISFGSQWEVGIGTYTASTNSLARSTVLSSSNSGLLVNFAAGLKDIILSQPAERAVYVDGTTLVASNNAVLPVVSGGTGATTAAQARTSLDAQQTLISGANIKTVNSTSLLGSGDVAVQPVLVSGTNIKTVNGNSLLGSGDVAIAGVSTNTPNTLVQRDASGNFAAGTITADLSGNATSATTATTATTATNQSGGTVNATTVAASGNVTLSGGTANGVAYLNGSKVLTTNSSLVFNGNDLGVGAAPSGWNAVFGTGWGIVEGKNGTAIGNLGNTSQTVVTANCYFDGAAWRFKNSDIASYYSQLLGQHSWQTSGLGTAGAVVSFTQLMVLTTIGLGIGTTPTAKLDVAGTGNFTGAVTGVTAAEKTATTAFATTAFVDRLRSLTTPSTGSGGGTAVVGDRGALLSVTAGVTIPANVFTTNDTFSIYNNSASSITITQGSSLTLRQVGTANTGNRTLAQRGLATVVFISATEAVITGGGLT